MKSLNCANCGAALSAQAIRFDIATCEFCGTSFRIPNTLTPEPDMGDLLLGADFADAHMPGWEVLNADKLKFLKGDPPEMFGVFKPDLTKSHYMLKSSGLLDDFDAGVNIKFTQGTLEKIRAGFYLRFTDDGGFGLLVSAQSSYTLGSFIKDAEGKLIWQKILAWTNHTALRHGFNVSNRLRVICNRDSFRVYLNGVLATSFKDARFPAGTLYLTVEPGDGLDGGFAFSDLQVREVSG